MEKTKISNYNENNSNFYGVISSLKLFKDKYLFAGTGNFLSIFNINNDKLEKKMKIFDSEKISKINIFSFPNPKNNNFLLIISGETKIKYTLSSDNIFNFQLNSIQTKSNDYIMNHILYSNFLNNEQKYLIIGFINNFIEIYQFNEEESQFRFIKYIFSNVKCIVYSMAFCLNKAYNSQGSINSILIASGTVFRKVIIWKILFSKDKNEFIKEENNLLELSGHKGVIFSVHFYSNNILCSTSDDRITKYWKFDLENKTFNSEDYIGHSSRVWDSKIYEPQNILVSISEDATALVYDLITKKCIGKLINGHEGWNIRSVEVNKEFIWTGGEDGRLIKWKYNKINNEVNTNNNLAQKREEINYEIKNEGKQYELACIKQKQKNFKCSIKVVKFLNNKIIILCTNHGQILGYDINEKQVKIIFYEDKEARVINSLDIIKEYKIMIVGLNDGIIIILSFENYDFEPTAIIKSSLVQIFNERVTFISHKIIDNKEELFIIISSEKGKIKMCYINNTNQINIIKIIQDNNSFLYFSFPFYSQINCFELKKIDNNNIQNKDKNRYYLFLGDYEGKIYFTQIKRISNHLFLFSNVLKNFSIFKKSIITSLIYSSNQNILFVHSRNNKIKKFTLTNEYSSSLFSLKEIESQTFQGINSYEKILYKDISSFEDENYYIIGHNGRDLIIYDVFHKKIIHKNDVKGVNKPLDLFLDYNKNKIYYISCQSNMAKIFTILINNNQDTENINGNLLISKSYCLPINGRVIHDINIYPLKNGKYLIFTAGEDTKIKFYYINNFEKIFDFENCENFQESIIHLGDFNMHNCAVRKILFIKEINNEFYFCSIGAKKEIFLFKLNIDNLNKPKFICVADFPPKNLENNSKKTKKFINNFEGEVENSRNMDLCLLNLENNKFRISITDTIDETSIITFGIGTENNIIDNIKDINKKVIKFTSSNFVPLCICCYTDKYLLYGQSNGILRIYNNLNKEEKFFKIHEAGINELKIYKLNSSENMFLLLSCGEDCTLVISEFDICKNEINIIHKIQNIHYSAIKSVDIVEYKNDLIITTGGYDQIINVCQLNIEKYTIKILKVFKTCTSEINSLKGILAKDKNNNNYCLYIAVGGLGMEFLRFKITE